MTYRTSLAHSNIYQSMVKRLAQRSLYLESMLPESVAGVKDTGERGRFADSVRVDMSNYFSIRYIILEIILDELIVT